MRPFRYLTPVLLIAAAALGGCAADGSTLLTTASIGGEEAPAASKKVSAMKTQCLALSQRIAALKAEGTVARVEQAADGKTRSVRVKRDALKKVAELNQANEEFQSSCSTVPVQAATPAPAPTAAATGAPAPKQSLAAVEATAAKTKEK